jgi:PAS domain S-box-containing protein
LALVGIALIVIVLAVAVAGILDRRKETILEARQEVAGLDVILAEETDGAMHTVDLVLREMQTKIRGAGISDLKQFEHLIESNATYDLLRGMLRDLPQGDRVGLIAADGKLVDGSQTSPAPAVDLSNRKFFEYLRAHDDTDLYIGATALSIDNKTTKLFFARRIDAPDGRFLGIAIIDANVDNFDNIKLVTDMGKSVAIFRQDCTMLAWYPSRPDGRAGELPQKSALCALIEKGGGTVISPGRVDDAPQLASLCPLDHFHLAVSVSVSEETVLANWRLHSIMIGIGALFLAGIFAVLFRVLVKRSRSLERSTADLRDSESRFRDFALTSSDWFWETDAQHRFVYQSEQIRKFGQDPGNRLGRTRIDLAAEMQNEPEKWREHVAVLNAHEPFRNFVYARHISADPQHIVSLSGNPVFDPAGRFLGYRGTARNITEEVLAERSLRAAKAAAESANLAKSHFLANMSHELRTPLNAILGFAELLERGVVGPLPPRGQEYAGLIRQSGAHLLEVVNGLLDLARIDAGKLELQEERGVDPRRLIEQCVRLVERQADEAGLHLSVEIADPVPLLVADRTRLTEILLNLLSNAIKFTEPGGSISIALRRRTEGGVLFEVRDTGIGMSESEIEIALEPFGQIDPGLCRGQPGAGLGLPLARRFAELHGGSLLVDSEKGVGTTVTLLLPAIRVVGVPAFVEAAARATGN